MRTQWKRWNWGLQQSPGRKSRLSQDRKLLLAASTWLDWPLRVSWPPAAGRAVWAALQGTKRCFHCVLIGRPSCRKQQPRQHGLGRVNQTKAQNREAPSERVRLISVVLSVSVVRESGAFSLWWSAVSAYDRLVSNSQLLQIYRSRWVSQHMSQRGVLVVCSLIEVQHCFYLTAKGLPHPDWSCCTTSTLCIMTLLHVSSRFFFPL